VQQYGGAICGSGVAIFDSSGDTIDNNTIDHNLYGVRLSVGAPNLTVTNNTVSNSAQYGVFSYQGNDTPAYTNSHVGRAVDAGWRNPDAHLGTDRHRHGDRHGQPVSRSPNEGCRKRSPVGLAAGR
jgi:parallel beta-helix repeat protein